jgi:Domain of unknown function (DUF4160)
MLQFGYVIAQRIQPVMPEISRFLGIVIFIYYQEHGIPHFHARYNDQIASFSIQDLRLMKGSLPKRALALVLEWAFQHRQELEEDWQLAQEMKPLKKIEPLE